MRRLYNDHVSDNQNRRECIDKFTHDTSLVQSMKMLAASEVMDVHLSDGNLVRTCGSSSCHQISVVRQRSDNASICTKCTDEKRRETKSDERRQVNWDQQVAADSKTPWGSLNEAQQKERIENNRQVKGSMKKN